LVPWNASQIQHNRIQVAKRSRYKRGSIGYRPLALVVVGRSDHGELNRNHMTCGDQAIGDVQVGDKGLGLSTGIVENGFKLR